MPERRSLEEEALEDDLGANASLTGATSGGADGLTSNASSTVVPYEVEE